MNTLLPCSFLQAGKLPRNLPALRAMEMAERTNSYAAGRAAGQLPLQQQQPTAAMEDDSDDSEMEYMIPLHSE